MEANGVVCSFSSKMEIPAHSEEEMELRRGPWTIEEDLILVKCIENHGEGRWNSLARSSGLKRTGKSCRLRWLNYLRPDVRRGNISLEEQLLILELHCRFGNRWSRIAQHLPGRTDNEIKNYWRTRVQKHAKQLQCDVNSKKFKDVMRHLWMPRLLERIQAASGVPGPLHSADVSGELPIPAHGQSPEASCSDSVGTRFSSPPTLDAAAPNPQGVPSGEINSRDRIVEFGNVEQSSGGYPYQRLLDLEQWETSGSLWNVDDIWF